jgi:hypothetical protein
MTYGAEVWQIPTREINKILSTEIIILYYIILYISIIRKSARKSRMERIKNEHIKEILGVKGKPDIIEKKRLQWYGHIKRMPEERILKLTMEWIPEERRKRGCPRKMRMEGVQTAMTRRDIEPDHWRNSEEWHLVSGRQRQLL